MLVMDLWLAQTALTESGAVSLLVGVSAVVLAGFSGGILWGLSEPDAIPADELSPLTSRLVIAMLVVGLVASLGILLIPSG